MPFMIAMDAAILSVFARPALAIPSRTRDNLLQKTGWYLRKFL
jgi:hypothetical protein